MPATKDQIADTFERHVERFGYRKASVEDVAAELRISKKTVYEHFSSKRDIYAYVIDRIAETMRHDLRAAVSRLPSWGEKVETLMRTVLTGARAHIEATSHADWHQEYVTAADALSQAVSDVMAELIAGGVESGEFAFSDVAVAERCIRAMALEYTLMVRDDPALDADEALAAAVRRFLG